MMARVRAADRESTNMTTRVVVVTGASGGIGSAIAEAFTAAGAAVVGLDLLDGFDVCDPASVREAVDPCRAPGRNLYSGANLGRGEGRLKADSLGPG